MHLDLVICDAPKRAFVKKFSGHGHYHGCDYCLVRADNIRVPGSVGNHRVYPNHKDEGPRRTPAQTLRLLAEGAIEADKKGGVKGKSLLFQLPYFDLILQVPVDPMHNLCEGIVKMLLE